MNNKKGFVNIHGKEYAEVGYRVALFRKSLAKYTGWSIDTNIVASGEDWVIIKAEIKHDGNVVAAGHARDAKNDSSKHTKSWVEIGETSAVGRALAMMGGEFQGSDYKIASAEEMSHAISESKAKKPKGETGSQRRKAAGARLLAAKQKLGAKVFKDLNIPSSAQAQSISADELDDFADLAEMRIRLDEMIIKLVTLIGQPEADMFLDLYSPLVVAQNIADCGRAIEKELAGGQR